MLLTLRVILALCAVAVYSAPQANEDDQNRPSVNTWAVLVAGSRKWIRYRHQV